MVESAHRDVYIYYVYRCDSLCQHVHVRGAEVRGGAVDLVGTEEEAGRQVVARHLWAHTDAYNRGAGGRSIRRRVRRQLRAGDGVWNEPPVRAGESENCTAWTSLPIFVAQRRTVQLIDRWIEHDHLHDGMHYCNWTYRLRLKDSNRVRETR
jgi:hypothetical protein